MCSIVGSCMITVGIQNGYGQHVWDLDSSKAARVIKYDYLAQTFGIAGGTVGRLAFICFIQGVLAIMIPQKIILWVFAGFQVVVNAMFILIIYLQCPGHTSGIWEHSGKAKCWSLHVQAYYGYFQGGKDSVRFLESLIRPTDELMLAFNALTDLYLAIFATYTCWSLKLPLRSRVGVMVLLGMGIL